MRRWAAAIALALVTAAPAAARHRGAPLPFPEVLPPFENPPLPEGFSFTQQVPASGPEKPGAGLIDSPREISRRLAACWTIPGAREGAHIEVSVKLSFRADGAVIGKPFVTFVNAGPGGAARADIEASIRDAIQRCAPLPFTAKLGAAIAGQIFQIRFVSYPPKPKDIST